MLKRLTNLLRRLKPHTDNPKPCGCVPAVLTALEPTAPPHLFPLASEIRITGDYCRKCGLNFNDIHQPFRYANDGDFGERFLMTCVQCGYRWSAPTLDG